jgi:hypothetical protein
LGIVAKKNLNFRWREIPRLLLILKSGGLVSSIAKRLVCGMAAAAQPYGGASAESKGAALHVHQFNFPFDTQRSIIANNDFR